MIPTPEDLQKELQYALKAGDRLRASTVRLLLSDLKYASVAKGSALTEEEIGQAVQRQIKRREEAIEQYEKGGREDLASKEAAELKMLMGYLPPQLADEEVGEIVREAVAKAGAAGPRDKGKVMSLVMPQVKGKADGRLVSKLVDEALSQ